MSLKAAQKGKHTVPGASNSAVAYSRRRRT
jgi:hypothetical protein